MLTFQQYLTELKRKRLFHVGPADLKAGEDLKSLTSQIGAKKAKSEFKKRWGHMTFSNKGGLDAAAKTQTNYVHLSDYWDDFDPVNRRGGTYRFEKEHKKPMALYDIRPGRNMPNQVERDKEFKHLKVKDNIPARYVRNKWNEKTRKWEPFNRQFKDKSE